MQSMKVDIVYYVVPTDFELEFNLSGCCRMRLLTSLSHDRKGYVEALARAVSRSKIILACGPIFGEDGLIYMTSKAIGRPLTLINNRDYGIADEQNVRVIEGSLPLVTSSGLFGGVIIESGPQTIIILSENRDVRKNIMQTLIHPYIQEISIMEIRKSTASVPQHTAEPALKDAAEIPSSLAAAPTDADTAAEIPPEILSAAADIALSSGDVPAFSGDPAADTSYEAEKKAVEELSEDTETDNGVSDEIEFDFFGEEPISEPEVLEDTASAYEEPPREEPETAAEFAPFDGEETAAPEEPAAELTETAEPEITKAEETAEADETEVSDFTADTETTADTDENAASGEEGEGEKEAVSAEVNDGEETADDPADAVMRDTAVSIEDLLKIEDGEGSVIADDGENEIDDGDDAFFTPSAENDMYVAEPTGNFEKRGNKSLNVSIVIIAVLLAIIAAALCYLLLWLPYSRGMSTSEFLREALSPAAVALTAPSGLIK